MPKFLDKVENTLNGYVADAKNIKGTYVVVEDTEALSALPTATLVEGTMAYNQEDTNLYLYDGTNWDIWQKGVPFLEIEVQGNVITGSSAQTYTPNASQIAFIEENFAKPSIISFYYLNYTGGEYVKMSYLFYTTGSWTPGGKKEQYWTYISGQPTTSQYAGSTKYLVYSYETQKLTIHPSKVSELSSNKKIDIAANKTSNQYYPTTKAVYNFVKDETKYIVVDTATNLPSSNVAEGTLAYVQDTDSFKLYNGSAWTSIDIINSDSSGSEGSSTPSQPTIPERFSIAYNLVVNMNGKQFDMIGVQAGGSIPGGMYPLTKWSDPQTNIEGYTYRTLQHREYDETNQQFTQYTTASEAKAKELVEFLTGVDVLDAYNATKPTPCFIFCTESNTCWKLQYDGSTNGLRAYKVNNFPLAFKDDVNPIIDVTQLPVTNINDNKFYRVEQIGEDIVVGVPANFTTPFCNLVFNTDLSVSEVMEIISDTSIAYNQNEKEVNGVTLEFGFYNITWDYNRPENSYSILYCPESLGTPFALIVNWCFMKLMQNETPSGTPQVLWCNNGTILSQFTGGQMSFTGWLPNMTNPIDLVFWINQATEQNNTATSNNKLTNLVWCSKYNSLKKITELYEGGDSSTTAVSMCKAFFSQMFNNQVTTVTTMPSSASDVKTNILNGNYPYYIHKDSDTQYYIVALLVAYNATTLEPNTGVTPYSYIEVITLDSDNNNAPTAVQNMLYDLQTIYYAIQETMPGTMTVNLEVKKKVTLYHHKNKWHEVGAGGGLESDVLYTHIQTLENIIALQRNKIVVTNNGSAVVFTVQDDED